MVPVIHIFYANETQTRGFNGITLYPMQCGLTDCVQSGYDGVDLTIEKARRECLARGFDSRTPILAHKVSHNRVDEIRTRIKG